MQRYDYLDSLIIINTHNKNKMYGRVRLEHVSDLSSTISVTHKDDLNSKVTVKPKNKMFGLIDIQETVIEQTGIPPIKDAFVRSLYKTLNYGEQEDIYIGHNHTSYFDEVYRSFLQFNPKHLPQNVKIVSAKLVLFPRRYDEFIPDIELYAADKHWDEQGVTFANQPQPTDLIAKYTESTRNKREIEFDLTHMIESWYKEEYAVHGFILQSSDEVMNQYFRFWAREGLLPPRLVVEYIDPNPPSIAKFDLNSVINVKFAGKSDLESTIEVLPPIIKDKDEDLDSTLTVRNNSYLDSTIIVNGATVNSKITVETPIDLLSKIGVIGYMADDISSVVYVSNPYINSKITIENPADLNARIKVTTYGREDVNSKIFVNVPFVFSKIDVTNHENIESVVRISQPDFVSKINVYHTPDLLSGIGVWGYTDDDLNSKISTMFVGREYLDSRITVQRHSEDDIDSKLLVHRTWVNSVINVTNWEDLISIVKVRRYDESELDSQLTVRRWENEELNSKIHITWFDELPSSITVRNHNSDDQDSTIQIRRWDDSDLNSKLHVMWTDDLDSMIVAREVKYSYLDSKLTIRRHDNKDVNATIDVTNWEDMDTILRVTQAELWTRIQVKRDADDYIDGKIVVLPTSQLDSTIDVTMVADLPTEIKVMIPFASDLNSQITLRDTSIMDTIIRVRRYDENDLSTKITVQRNEDDDIDSTLIVRRWENDELSSIICVRNHKHDDVDAEITVQATSEVPSIVSVVGVNDLDSLIVIRNHVDDDIPSRIDIDDESILYATVQVRRHESDDLNTIINTKAYGESNIDSTIKVVNEVDEWLDSKVNVRPTNRMYGMVDILEPPKEEYIDSPVKDAYVRLERPLFNYGSAVDMYVGKYGDDLFRSFLAFEKPNIDLSVSKIISAKIILTTGDLNGIAPDLQLFESENHFYEMGITYENQPSHTGRLAAEVTENVFNKTTVEFDIKDILEDWINGVAFQHGFVLVTSDESVNGRKRFFTKESSYPPKLKIEYYDTRVKNHHRNDLSTLLRVTTLSEDELDSIIKVPSYDNDVDLPTELIVRNTGYLDAVLKVTRGDLDSKIEVQRNEYEDLNSVIVVRLDDIDELKTVVKANQPSQNSQIKVRRHSEDELDSKLTVRRHSESDQLSQIEIRNFADNDAPSIVKASNPTIDSVINVNPSSELPSIIIVRNHVDDGIDSTIEVTRKSDLDSKIHVTWFDDNLYAQIEVYREELNSRIKVVYSDEDEINSIIRVVTPNKSDIDSKIEVLHFSDLDSTIEIWSRQRADDVNSIIRVPEWDYLDSKVTVRLHDENTVDSEIEVLHAKSIDSVIEVLHAESLDSRIKIREIDAEDLDSVIDIDYGKAINSTVTVRRHSNADMDVLLNVRPTEELPSVIEVLQINDIYSQLTVRQNKDEDLESTLTVVQIDEIDSKIEIVAVSDLDSTLLVREIDAADIDSEITVVHSQDIDSKITVTNYEDLSSIINVGDAHDSYLDSKIEVSDEIIGYVFIF